MFTKKIAVLAKSAKNGSFCVAGLSNKGEWIRPISKNPEIKNAVPVEDTIFSDGTNLKILDVVEIQFLKSQDNFIQPENFYYDDKIVWKKVGNVTLEKIINWHGFDDREKIFYNFDRFVEPKTIQRQKIKESLLILQIKNLSIKIELAEERKKFFADFEYNDTNYKNFSVGDIKIRTIFEDYDVGEYFFRKDAVAVISLTDIFEHTNKCYKMIAQIF